MKRVRCKAAMAWNRQLLMTSLCVQNKASPWLKTSQKTDKAEYGLMLNIKTNDYYSYISI